MGEIVSGEIYPGISLRPLNVFEDPRGAVLHMMKKSFPEFKDFGEVYFSFTNYGVIKGWKKHLKMTQNIVVPHGTMQFAIYDDREDSETKGQVLKINIGRNNYSLLTIAPGLWYSFKAMSESGALIANCADIEHDPTESIVKDLSDGIFPNIWQ